MMWSCAYILSCAWKLVSRCRYVRMYSKTPIGVSIAKVTACCTYPSSRQSSRLFESHPRNYRRVHASETGKQRSMMTQIGERFCRRISVSVPTIRAGLLAVTSKHFRYIDHWFFHPPAPASSHTVATYPSLYVYTWLDRADWARPACVRHMPWVSLIAPPIKDPPICTMHARYD